MKGLKKRGRDPLRFLDGAMMRWMKKESLKTFSFREVTRLETINFIRKLGNTTAHGMDGLDMLSINSATEELSGPLRHIINVSIRTNTFANKWKLSRIIPILKSKDSNCLEP